MRLGLPAAAAVIALGASGCGDSAPTTDPADALRYMPAEPALVVMIDTDVDGEQVEGLEETIGRDNELEDVERLLEQAFEGSPVSYEDDVEPHLGAPLVAGLEDPDRAPVAAISIADEDEVRETLEKVPDAGELWFVEDDVLVVATSAEDLAAARERHDADRGLDPERVEQALAALPEDALVRIYADVDDGIARLPELAPLTKEPWLATATTFGGTLSFDGSTMTGDAFLATDHASGDDLPLEDDTSEVPEVVVREGWVSGANLNQSRATAFLLRAVRAAFPDSDFVRDVATVERERGIDFEQEFLRQFDGPSQSLLHPDGRFAARSTVSDPERLAGTLREIAPDLGRLVEDLQGLRSTGLAALLLLAPDAPAATSVLDSATIRVEPLGRDLYRMSGLVGPGPDEIVFGLVDDVFVVAEDEASAEEIATAPTEEFDGPGGTAVAQATGEPLERAFDLLGVGDGLNAPTSANGSLYAEEDGLRAKLVAEFGD